MGNGALQAKAGRIGMEEIMVCSEEHTGAAQRRRGAQRRLLRHEAGWKGWGEHCNECCWILKKKESI